MTRDELKSAIHDQPAHSVVSVAFLDLDGLQRLNHGVGHQHIDAMLGEVVTRVARVAGQRAHIARWGGDEFVCVIENPRDAPNLMRVMADRLRDAVRDDPFKLVEAVELTEAWSACVLNELCPTRTRGRYAIRARHTLDGPGPTDKWLPAVVTEVWLTVSIGVATAARLEDALDLAEQASVDAKLQGRDRAHVAPTP